MVWVVAWFTEGNAPKTGLSPTLDIWRVSDDVQVVTAGAMTEIGGGHYKYDFSAYDSDEVYVSTFDGGASLGDIERYQPGVSAVADIKGILQEAVNIIPIVESQRGAHTGGHGQVLYVDPVNGASYASGARGGVNDPFASVQDCHDNMVIDSNHDIVILVPGSASGVTTLTEDVTLTKRYTFYRGPGRDFHWTRSGAGDTITVEGDGMEFSGFQLETDTIGAGNGITLDDVDFSYIHDIWVNQTRGHGIEGTDCSNTRIVNNTFFETGQGGSGRGVTITSTGAGAQGNIIKGNHFSEVAGHGVHITGGNTINTVIAKNVIHDCTGWGVNVNSVDCEDTFVIQNLFGNNASGDIQDNGTDTVIANNEQWAKETTAQLILEDTGTTLPAEHANIVVEIDANEAKIDLLQIDTTAIIAHLVAIKGAGWVDENLTTIDSVVDAIQAVTDNLPDSGALTTIITHLTDIKGGGWVDENLTTIDAIVDAINANVDQSLSTTEDNIRGADDDDLKDISDQIDAIDIELDSILRVLGLVHENHFIDQYVYDGNFITSARIRTYTDAVSVGTDSNVLATYTMTATYSAGLLLTYKVVKV